MEGRPQDATMPLGWHACEVGTTPDICPDTWGVDQEPYEGQSYIGLITRPDGSWESIGQRLSHSLEKAECYVFSVVLAHSDAYAGYNAPALLRIWLGNEKCKKLYLIGETGAIRHYEWKEYIFNFTPDKTYSHIILECYYPFERVFSSGNILIDRLSTFQKCKRT
jgi:hypothetical protein